MMKWVRDQEALETKRSLGTFFSVRREEGLAGFSRGARRGSHWKAPAIHTVGLDEDDGNGESGKRQDSESTMAQPGLPDGLDLRVERRRNL